jgi:hypothetical protein
MLSLLAQAPTLPLTVFANVNRAVADTIIAIPGLEPLGYGLKAMSGLATFTSNGMLAILNLPKR